MAVLANNPQVIPSLIYLQYSGLLTNVFTAADFSTFTTKAQNLMVSSPAEEQRRTWLLGLPLGYGLGSLALQTLLHWFVSQSTFPVQVAFFDVDGRRDESYRESNCGYSLIAIIFVLNTGFLLAVSAVVFGARKFEDGGPPVDCTNSAAISAACHYPGVKYKLLVYEKLRWGVTGRSWNGKGHCSMAPASAWDQRVADDLPPGVIQGDGDGTRQMKNGFKDDA